MTPATGAKAGKEHERLIPEVYCANHCSWVGMEEDLLGDDAGHEPHCPKCESNYFILEIPDDWEDLEECRRAVERFHKRKVALVDERESEGR